MPIVPRSSRKLDDAALVELAYRKLNLGRSRWMVECVSISSDRVFLRTTDNTSRRFVDRSAPFRTRAELPTAFIAAVDDSIAELKATG